MRKTGDAVAAVADADAASDAVVVAVTDAAAKAIVTMHLQNPEEEDVEGSNQGNQTAKSPPTHC